MAVDGKLHAPAALLPGMTIYPLHRMLSWTKTVWMVAENDTPPECDPLTNKTLARHYTDCAIPAHITI